MAAFHSKISALAGICLLLALQAHAYTMSDMCAQMSSDGYVGNPTNCSKWGYCKGQVLVGEGACASGLVYESKTATCQYNTKCACSTSMTETCKVLKTPVYLADPNDCQSYSYCFGNGTALTGKCPAGQTYAASTTSCVWGPDCQQDSICRFMKNNIYVGDPSTCGNYIACVDGYGTSSTCGTNAAGATLYYNKATGNCQPTNPCSSSGGDTSTGTGTVTPAPINTSGCPALSTSSTSSTSSTESTATEADADDTTTSDDTDETTESSSTVKYVADNTTCYGFYSCLESSYGKWGACPYGTEFDATAQKCVSPAAIVCTYDRCANTNMTYAAVPNTNCNQYTYCPNGSVGTCPTGYLYFDERYGKCVPTKPATAICGATTA
ncbi:peritrophin-44 isoform X1 [Drosophila albomicans]|uniref:Peritrophin-44 isoform X1 n=1 Tax=Drosophila albomicans TaxID=7291 RepID=A0A6P8X293_DROAB|nr:peritrophin-44 isoform X1 [Drosophila albomicans]